MNNPQATQGRDPGRGRTRSSVGEPGLEHIDGLNYRLARCLASGKGPAAMLNRSGVLSSVMCASTRFLPRSCNGRCSGQRADGTRELFERPPIRHECCFRPADQAMHRSARVLAAPHKGQRPSRRLADHAMLGQFAAGPCQPSCRSAEIRPSQSRDRGGCDNSRRWLPQKSADNPVVGYESAAFTS